MDVLNVVLDVVHEKMPRNIFEFQIVIELGQDVFVGLGFDQFEILLDASDEGLDFVDPDGGFLASFEAPGVGVLIVDGCALEMNAFQ